MSVHLTPEVVLVGDHTRSRIEWTLQRETERIATLADEHPEIAAMLRDNGWTPRMLAFGHVLAGLCDLAAFDDEDGRA